MSNRRLKCLSELTNIIKDKSDKPETCNQNWLTNFIVEQEEAEAVKVEQKVAEAEKVEWEVAETEKVEQKAAEEELTS